MSTFLKLCVLLLAIAGASVCGQAVERPVRVAIVGASLSGGFNAAATDGQSASNLLALTAPALQIERGMKLLWPAPGAEIQSFARVNLFQQPETGFRQLRSAARMEPDLLIAIDFPFWFGYGRPPRGLEMEARTQWRYAQQRRMLRALDEFDIPIVLGDYPDLTEADRRMIPGALIPDRPTIATLNSRLRAFASQRPRMQVVPMAALFEDLRAGRWRTRLPDGRTLAVSAGHALQWDRMHPTALGMGLFHAWLQDAVDQRGWPKKLRFEPRPLPDFLNAVGAMETFERLSRGEAVPESAFPLPLGR